MPVVTFEVTDAADAPVEDALVVIRAKGSGSEPVFYDGALVKPLKLHTSNLGIVSPTLPANALCIPSESYYTVEVQVPGERKPVKDKIQVPNGAGPYLWKNILHDPGTVETSALAAHAAKTAEDDDVHGSKTYTDSAIADLVGSAGSALDTLGELSDALGDDANFAATVTTSLAGKASTANLTAETNARTSADETLQDNIDAEATARSSADTALQTDIDSKETPAGAQAKVDALGLNAKAYAGAVGNGVADDTVAIQAALDAGSAVVFVPDGDYLITAVLDVPAGTRLVMSDGATFLYDSITLEHLCDIEANDVSIEGGTIDGLSPTPTGNPANSAVFIGTGVSDVLIKGTRFVDMEGSGVRSKGLTGPPTARVHVRECYFENTGHHSVFFNWETVDSSIIGNVFNTTAAATADAIWVGNGSTNARIMGNRIIDPGDMGIEVWGGCDGSVISGNVITGPGEFGISVDGSEGCSISDNVVSGWGRSGAASIGIEVVNGSHRTTVSGNDLDGLDAANASRGISLNGSDDCSIVGGVIANVAGSGIRFASSPERTSIAGVAISDCTNYGIEFTATDIDITISGCMVFDCGRGIGRSAGSPARVNIVACTITDCLTEGIAFLSITNGSIVGNTIVATAGTATGEGIQVGSTATEVAIIGNRITGYAGAGGDGIHATSTATQVVIVGNDVRGNTNAILNQSTSAYQSSNLGATGDILQEGQHFTLGTTTGTKIGTATTQKLGFWNATPVVRPSAYTQTYSTADKTLAAYTADVESSAYTGAADSEAKLADLNALRVAYENLRAFTEDLAQHHNALLDDLQTMGLLA